MELLFVAAFFSTKRSDRYPERMSFDPFGLHGTCNLDVSCGSVYMHGDVESANASLCYTLW